MDRRTLLALALGVLLVAAPFARADEEYYDDDDGGGDDNEPDVVVLTSSNFDKIVGGSKFALVEFYAPWCGHCKNLAPHYSKAATALKKTHPDVIIAKVDATENQELGTKFEVQGFPTLKWFVDGEVAMDYGGGRDEEGIISWVKKKTGPFAETAESTDALKALEADNPALIVAYFKAFEGEAYDAFKSVATKIEDVTFVQTMSADVAAAAGLSSEGVAAVQNFAGEDRSTVVAESSDSADALKAFITKEKMPTTIEFSKSTTEKIFNSGIPKQIIYWSTAADMATDSANFKALREVATEYRGQLVFVTSNSEGAEAEPITNFFGLEGKPGPVVIGFEMTANKKYRMTDELTAASLSEFAKSVLDGSAPRDFKSADIPEKPTEQEVTVVVGKTFESIVLDESKDVLLEVYAPWCGHCKQLAPIYTKLAKRFRSVDSVVIAKMDGTENEHELANAKGYPTLLFFPAGSDKKPIAFEGGDRTLKTLTKFIKQHAKTEYELPKKADKTEENSEDSGAKHDEL